MKKLICLRGIPASGKSTWAKYEVEHNWAIRFNKDLIRKEFRNRDVSSEYSKKDFEKIVYEVERDRVESAIKVLEYPYIIVDNTHLWDYNKHIEFYRSLAEQNWYEFEIKDFYCSRYEAIRRDSQRPEDERVGAEVIDRMIKIQGNWGYPKNPTFVEKDESLWDAVIVDIDWTIAFMDWKRNPYDFDKVYLDRPNKYLIDLVNLLSKTHTVIIVSWRWEECRDVTEKWLLDSWIFYDFFYMRAIDDRRCDSIVKWEIYEQNIKWNVNVVAVFDDRNRVVETWRLKYNLPTYQCWYWDF